MPSNENVVSLLSIHSLVIATNERLNHCFCSAEERRQCSTEEVSKHSAVSRGEIAERGCDVVGRVDLVIESQSQVDRQVF